MHIAVTGGSGRIGRAIISLALAQGHHIVSIDRVAPPEDAVQPNVDYIQGDLTDYEAFAAALHDCEALIHMGAIPSPGRHPDYMVHNNNVVSSYNALSAAAHLGITRVCQASSINAIGGIFSRAPRYDYFPLNELHPTYNEDPYSLSKWICEQQGDSFARRYETMTIASMRFHAVVPERASLARSPINLTGRVSKDLWGYTRFDAAARACLLALTPKFEGHEVFYILAPDTSSPVPTLELKQRFYPDVPVRGDLSDHHSFFDCTKAERLLGWKHNEH